MIERIKQFLRESKNELKKVVFPTRQEVVGATQVVIVVVLCVAAFLWAVDLLLMHAVGYLFR